MSQTPDASIPSAPSAGPAGTPAPSAGPGPDAKGKPAGPGGAPRHGASGEEQKKPPARPAAEVRADIVKERAALGASFDGLREDLDDAVDAGKQRVSGLGRKAKIAAPIAGAAIAVALFLRSWRRDRR